MSDTKNLPYITRLQNQRLDLQTQRDELQTQLKAADQEIRNLLDQIRDLRKNNYGPERNSAILELIGHLGADRRLGRLSPASERAFDRLLSQLGDG